MPNPTIPPQTGCQTPARGIRASATDHPRPPLGTEPQTAREKALLEALKAASAHLDYCGYGDSWERECATSAGLPEQIATALKAYP